MYVHVHVCKRNGSVPVRMKILNKNKKNEDRQALKKKNEGHIEAFSEACVL